ncbi:endolytic transglycosylase MltG [Actinokineospora sp. UTMC 2448]|uniref:endolytic transglycosylase MltG n=1 Tax=Actinokineospora sp. UTMC 2448 TaxID=2268449 RepID=UPI002164A3F8|nr:endolytic transglycosylase MltG [Actinokineospora sp. UTMC 2448]UVS78280.1 putative aminodeoxychorismate lyase [Actinokineospora sp. UTMC 2448]
MNDGLDLFDDHSDRDHRSRGKRVKLAVFGLLIVLLIGAGVWYGWRQLSGLGGYDDFAGPGETDIVIEVKPGDSTGAIAGTLVEQGVVASSRAFVAAAENNAQVRSIQPGFYVMRTKISGQDAVTRIVDPEARVGNLQIKPGTQLHDIKKADNTVTPGVASLLSKASCAELNGKSTCVAAKDLLQVAEKADLANLGVPDWALADANKAPRERRLEGLVAPAVYDVRPGATAEELWTKLLADSSAHWQSYGMPGIADSSGFTPYQFLTMASLVQREGIEKDFGKVARVIYNRLEIGMELAFDSTVNYVLDRPNIATSDADRERAGPYNTYKNMGLTPTPISSASKEALAAVAEPPAGKWLFFVLCQKDGTSCFAETYEEHLDNRDLARENGAF